MSKLKLSPIQKDVIEKMRDGFTLSKRSSLLMHPVKIVLSKESKPNVNIRHQTFDFLIREAIIFYLGENKGILTYSLTRHSESISI